MGGSTTTYSCMNPSYPACVQTSVPDYTFMYELNPNPSAFVLQPL